MLRFIAIICLIVFASAMPMEDNAFRADGGLTPTGDVGSKEQSLQQDIPLQDSATINTEIKVDQVLDTIADNAENNKQALVQQGEAPKETGEELPGWRPKETCREKQEAQAGANSALEESVNALKEATEAYESALRDKVKAEQALENAERELATAKATQTAAQTSRDNADNAFKQASDATIECIAKFGAAESL